MNTLKTHYESVASDYGMPKRRQEAILGLLGKDLIDKKILDIGCANGLFGKELEKLGGKVTGIDISEKAIKLAKKNISEAKVVDLNEGKLPFADNSFDTIVASEVLEHLFAPEELLKEIKRILKSDGVAVITAPNLLYWGHRLKFLKGEFKYEQSGPFDRGHIHFYTYETLIGDLKTVGLKVKKEKHIVLSRLSKTLLNRLPALFAYQMVILCQKV